MDRPAQRCTDEMTGGGGGEDAHECGSGGALPPVRMGLPPLKGKEGLKPGLGVRRFQGAAGEGSNLVSGLVQALKSQAIRDGCDHFLSQFPSLSLSWPIYKIRFLTPTVVRS